MSQDQEAAGAHMMTQAERDSWREASKSTSAAGAAAGAPRPPSQHRLGEMLLSACSIGSLAGVKEALEAGANPNARIRPMAGTSAFGLAIERGHVSVALAVLLAGGWPAPSRGEREANAKFEKAVKEGVFEPAHREALAAQSLHLLSSRLDSWHELAKARSWCDPKIKDGDLIGMAMLSGRFDVAKGGIEATGASIPAASWRVFARRMGEGPVSVDSSAPVAGDRFAALLGEPKAIEFMGEAAAKAAYLVAIEAGSIKLMRALLDAGVRPGPDWIVDRRHHRAHVYYHEPKASAAILWLAAASTPEIYALAKACPPAVEAAKRSKAVPSIMADVAIGRVLELAELGLSIDGRDDAGRGLSHIWAHRDQEPRDGWASLARKHPEVSDMLDHLGRTGRQAMAEKLHGEDKDEFMAAFARHETREIKRGMGPKKKSFAQARAARL